jgi:aminoglycoside phosphotransferase family enzyme
MQTCSVTRRKRSASSEQRQPLAGAVSPRTEPSLEEKVAHLSCADSYVEGATSVEIVETHMSYVFLTDSHAYKLKKPVRYRFLNLGSSDARRWNCEEALRLNGRLADGVCLGVVPLSMCADALKVDDPTHPIDWLLKMRRLPKQLMLDRAIDEARVTRQDVVRFTRALASFYAKADRTRCDAAEYRAAFMNSVLQSHEMLSTPAFGCNIHMLDALKNKLVRFLHGSAALLNARVNKNMIVEGHGNLRPEHVCLSPEPVFIDCVESDLALRTVDPADELGYLTVECDFLGANHLRETIFATYQACTRDAVDERLVAFYQGQRALFRARIAAAHLEEPLSDHKRVRWLSGAHAYLRLADRYCQALS